MDRTARSRTLIVLFSIIVIVIVYLLFNFTLNAYFVTEYTVSHVHVAVWVPYLTAILLLIFILLAVKMAGRERVGFVLIACLLAAVFALSLRTLRYSASSGEIRQTWAGIYSSKYALMDLNNKTYCYKKSFLNLEFEPSQSGEIVKFPDGFWPSVFSDGSLKTAFMGDIKRC